MKWQFLDPDLVGFRSDSLLCPATALVMAPVSDNRAHLLIPEQNELGVMAEIRQFGFSSGRYCAHLAQELLGLDPLPVLREDRVPVWPAHSVGSITHSAKIAAAVASTAQTSVGVDIEQSGRVDEKLYRMLFTDEEKQALENFDFDAATVMFSAKEAGYKAIYPIGQEFIGFKEAEIKLDAQTQTFTIDYLGEHAPNKALNTGQGYWRQHEDHILTLFVIP